VPDGPNLLIVGASTRAAAFSALRAGLRPWCADLFADVDLQARCPAMRVPFAGYPRQFLEIARAGPPGPWMYTGALENHGILVDEIGHLRPKWGNDRFTMHVAREPSLLQDILGRAGMPYPAVWVNLMRDPPPGRWLVKPVHGAGGRGIHFWDGRMLIRMRGWFYLQAYVEGTPCAAVYVGDGRCARLLGATEQLVGERWLHARPFHYCGSIGPLPLEPPLQETLERLGNVVASGCGLRGLFGVDLILKDGAPWPVEVNPRYPASVEVLEYAAGVPALALHGQVFDPAAPSAPASPGNGRFLGKAILFAREALTFPEDGPWTSVLRTPGPVEEAPAFADIPAAGQSIEAGRPVLTCFAWGHSVRDCRDALQQIAADLDRRLFGR
jgi:predicted ATP-grasp superfamily ATP-dependent carboligase